MKKKQRSELVGGHCSSLGHGASLPNMRIQTGQNRSYGRAAMKNQVDINTIVDAVYEAVLYLTGDVHQARWDAYWTLMTLLYPEMPAMEEAA
jgi:hypothetical protein